MADVEPPRRAPPKTASRIRSDDRAQLFLIGALALSVILVTLAVLLNTAIYTGNVATRDPGPGTTEVIEYERAADEMATRSVTAVNYGNNSSYAALESNFTAVVANWSQAANTHQVIVGADGYTTTASMTRGTRIGRDSVGNFTSDGGAADWTVANDSHVRAFQMNVSQASLNAFNADVGTLLGWEASSYFRVIFRDTTGDEWEVYLHQKAGDVALNVVDPAGNEVGDGCTEPPGADGYATVDITNASLAGQPCPELRFFSNLTGTYDIDYGKADGTNVEGTYSMVVDRPLPMLDTGADDDPSRAPYATPALYSADLRVNYRSPSAAYETQIRVAPGEPDA